MSNQSFRPTWADINLKHLEDNLITLRECHPTKDMIPVIKADAYGHGMITVADVLIKNHITMVAVAILEEALTLRDHAPSLDIMVLGVILPDQIKLCSEKEIIVTIHDLAFGEALLKCTSFIRCQINIDTGFHGLGMNNHADANALIERLQAATHIDLCGLYTHFATAESHYAMAEAQSNKFKAFVTQLKQRPPIIHMSNTAGCMTIEKYADFTTHIRPGLGLYGMSPMKNPPLHLKPVMTLKSKIVLIKTLNKGDTVSYGATYQAKTQEKIAVIPIGYADGWLRKNRSSVVEINQKLYPLIGTICMDLGMVKIDASVEVGDEVILFGGKVSVDDIASRLATINYEITTTVGTRVPRYTKTREEDEGKR